MFSAVFSPLRFEPCPVSSSGRILHTRTEMAVVAGLTLLSGWHFLFFPLGLDQGIYATSAMKMLEGAALYKDTWDMKSPGIFFMYMIPMGLVGKVWGIMALHLVLHGLTALAVLRLVRWHWGQTAAWASVGFYLFTMATWGDPIKNGQPDDWMLPFFLWGVVLLLSAWELAGTRAALYCAADAGLLMGWVLVLRSTMVFAITLAPLVWLAALAPEYIGRSSPNSSPCTSGQGQPGPSWLGRALPLLGAYVAGGAIVGLLMLGYFVATGSLSDMLYSQLVWVRSYAQTVINLNDLKFAIVSDWAICFWREFFAPYPFMMVWHWIIIAGALLWAAWRAFPLRSALQWLWVFALGASCYAVQLKFFNYHHWPLLPFICMGFGVAFASLMLPLAALWHRCEGRPRIRWCTAAVAVVVTLAVIIGGGYGDRLRSRQNLTAEFALGQATAYEFYRHLHFKHIYKPFEDHLITQLIRERTPSGELPSVFIWGFRPHVYAELGISGPSRFAYNLPLRAGWSPPEWLSALEGEVVPYNPQFILSGYNDNFNWVVGNELNSVQSMPS